VTLQAMLSERMDHAGLDAFVDLGVEPRRSSEALGQHEPETLDATGNLVGMFGQHVERARAILLVQRLGEAGRRANVDQLRAELCDWPMLPVMVRLDLLQRARADPWDMSQRLDVAVHDLPSPVPELLDDLLRGRLADARVGHEPGHHLIRGRRRVDLDRLEPKLPAVLRRDDPAAARREASPSLELSAELANERCLLALAVKLSDQDGEARRSCKFDAIDDAVDDVQVVMLLAAMHVRDLGYTLPAINRAIASTIDCLTISAVRSFV